MIDKPLSASRAKIGSRTAEYLVGENPWVMVFSLLFLATNICVSIMAGTVKMTGHFSAVATAKSKCQDESLARGMVDSGSLDSLMDMLYDNFLLKAYFSRNSIGQGIVSVIIMHPLQGPRMGAKEITEFRPRVEEFMRNQLYPTGGSIDFSYRGHGLRRANEDRTLKPVNLLFPNLQNQFVLGKRHTSSQGL